MRINASEGKMKKKDHLRRGLGRLLKPTVRRESPVVRASACTDKVAPCPLSLGEPCPPCPVAGWARASLPDPTQQPRPSREGRAPPQHGHTQVN